MSDYAKRLLLLREHAEAARYLRPDVYATQTNILRLIARRIISGAY